MAYSECVVAVLSTSWGQRRSEVMNELIEHVSWYLFKGALVTSTVERCSFVFVRGIEFEMATSYMQRKEY